MINLEPDDLVFVQSVLKKYIPHYTVWLFGSRVTDKIKPYSDIDLAIITHTKIDFNLLCDLNDAFIQSDLPYKVDLLDWSTLDDEFKKIIQKKYVVIQERDHSSLE